jgi:hypothetical protein
VQGTSLSIDANHELLVHLNRDADLLESPIALKNDCGSDRFVSHLLMGRPVYGHASAKNKKNFAIGKNFSKSRRNRTLSNRLIDQMVAPGT